MPHMPKHLTKGPYFEQMGINHSPPAAETADQRGTILTKLRNVAIPLEDVMTVAGVGATEGGGAEGAKTHVRDHWFGAGSPPGGQTGWWRNWKGEPEKTLRCGLIRALEVAMGLNHTCPYHLPAGIAGAAPTNPPGARTPGLPIDYYWVCGVSRFEVYVNWNARQVTVIIVTPGFPFNLVEDDDEYVVANGTGVAGTLDLWTRNPVGTVFIGQDEGASTNKLTVMTPGVVTHRMTVANGGSG